MLKDEYVAMAAALARGATAEEAGRPYGRSAESVRQLRTRNPEFRDLVRSLRLGAVQEAASLLDHEARDAVRVLAGIAKDSDHDPTRVRAAATLLNALVTVGESAALREEVADVRDELDRRKADRDDEGEAQWI